MTYSKFLLNQFDATITANSDHYHGENIAQGYVKEDGDFIYIYHVYNLQNNSYKHHEITSTGFMLLENNNDWYLVTYDNNFTELQHKKYLSNILESGHDMRDFHIIKLEQCYGGDESCLKKDHFC